MDAKMAAEIAGKNLGELYPVGTIADILLEEVEFSRENNSWLVTLSFTRPSDANPFTAKVSRIYKILEISDADATLVGLRIYSVD